MKKFLRYIGIFLAAGCITAFLVYTTMAFQWEKNTAWSLDSSGSSIEFQEPTLTGFTISYRPLSTDTITQNTVFNANFWRLSSAFLLAHEDGVSPNNIVSRNEKLLTVGKTSAIFSWYDPFKNYELQDEGKNFRLSQITSGSVYFSSEADGSIAIYSVDLVANLTFLSNGQEMTKMIIFPGMHVRFDPRLNASLKDADLLRIMQVLWNAKTATANTGIEFINPRADVSGNMIVGLVQLPVEKRKLFQYLQSAINTRVQALDILKQYSTVGNNGFANTQATNVQNPTKNMYRLLGELQIIFSRAVNGEMTAEDFRTRVLDIRSRAATFGLESKADELLQKFLTDGRFALYTDAANNSQYQALYTEAAKILHIVPDDGKGKLFQALSNTFSQSLIIPEKNSLVTSIETATSLKNTLNQGEIDTKDYFDISLYAFLVFEKMSWDEKTQANTFDRSLLEGNTIYELYSTIFRATQRYAESISDKEVAMNAQKSLVLEFYEPMLRTLVNSLYSVYAIHTDGNVVLWVSFVNNHGEPELSGHNHKDILRNITDINSIAKQIFDTKLQPIYGDRDAQTRNLMEMHIARLTGFKAMAGSSNYRQYQKFPYLAEGENIALPRYNVETKALVRTGVNDTLANSAGNTASAEQSTNAAPVASGSSTPINNTDAKRISTILSNVLGMKISPENVEKAGNIYRISLTHQERKISFAYAEAGNLVTGLSISGARELKFLEASSVTWLRVILANVANYENALQKMAEQSPATANGVVIMSLSRKQMQVGGQSIAIP